jgi:riboflavin biosynthesis pyrimidine reductase
MPEPAKPDYTSIEFPSAPPDRPYVLVNMVMSADGKVVIEGTERGLGSKVDQRLMRELRANADIVIAGAGTLRASGASSRVRHADLEALRTARGRPPNPIAAVLSGSGDLPLDGLFFTADDFDAVVYLSARAPEQRRDAIAATGRSVVVLDDGDEVPSMLRHMRRELGASVLLVEGGPSLNAELFARGFVDEFFLTLGPLVVGGEGTLSAVGGAPPTAESVTRLELVSAVSNSETSELYLRYRAAGRGAAGR